MILRNWFDEQLNSLNNELTVMGALCEEAISGAAKLLLDGDKNMKSLVCDADSRIDKKEREIEEMCLKLLMLQQPVAGDLRTISSALRIIADMERIGDQASDISEIAEYVTCSGLQGETHIADMARETIAMLTDSLESFVQKDTALAEKAIKHDDIVDGLFEKVKNELIYAVQIKSGNAEALVDLLMIAKYFERIGDHAENIAEWVIFSITGCREYEK